MFLNFFVVILRDEKTKITLGKVTKTREGEKSDFRNAILHAEFLNQLQNTQNNLLYFLHALGVCQ